MGALRRATPALAWMLLALGLIGMVLSGHSIREIRRLNAAIADGTVIADPSAAHDARIRYAQGWLHAEKGEFREAARRFAETESAGDPRLAAQAKLALGNLYFELGMAAANVAEGGSHQQGAAQLELAREAYRGALRIVPDFYPARYNLELLERIGPSRRTLGWSRETDGVTLQAFKRDGWAQMKDNPKRGLP
jgi:tetratricopeptide (TPR) repeat protein